MLTVTELFTTAGPFDPTVSRHRIQGVKLSTTRSHGMNGNSVNETMYGRYRRPMLRIARKGLVLGLLATMVSITVYPIHPSGTTAQNAHRMRFAHENVHKDARAPNFHLRSADGRLWALDELRGRRVLICFFCGCNACRTLARAISGLRSPARPRVQVLVVSHFDPQAADAFREDTGLEAVFLSDPFGDVGEAYHSLSCPRCWAISEGGTLAYTMAQLDGKGRSQLRQIAEYLAKSPE